MGDKSLRSFKSKEELHRHFSPEGLLPILGNQYLFEEMEEARVLTLKMWDEANADFTEVRTGVWKTRDGKHLVKTVTWASPDSENAGETGLEVFRVVHGNGELYLGWALDWEEVSQIIEEDEERAKAL